MIYDLFMFGGYDLDLLEVRLGTLSETVDKFLICEAPITHTLIPKSLVFLENQLRFERFKDKIIYITAKSEHSNPFVNDWNYRDILFNCIPNPSLNDIILTGDLDEIPNPDVLKEQITSLNRPTSFEVSYRFFTTDLFGRLDTSNILLKYGWVKEQFHKYRDARNTSLFTKIPNAGWHFSSCGKISDILNKWSAFAHSREISDKYKDPNYIISQIKRKAGSWSDEAPDNELKLVEHNYPNLPKFLLENKEKFKHLFYDYYTKS